MIKYIQPSKRHVPWRRKWYLEKYSSLNDCASSLDEKYNLSIMKDVAPCVLRWDVNPLSSDEERNAYTMVRAR